jgi:hypothetical protein
VAGLANRRAMRGGQATVPGICLRCRAHNQLEAERAFGAGFIERTRRNARQKAARRRAGPSRPGAAAGPS